MSRTRRRLVPRLFFLVVVSAPLFGASCPCALATLGDGGPHFTLTFHSLSTKTLPAQVEDDGDTKDVTVKDRVKFKPSLGDTEGPEQRLRLKSKREDGAACVAEEVQMTGDVTARILVAADSLEGLVDGASLGFLERRAAGGGPVLRVAATWNAALDGFVVSGTVDGAPAEDTLELPGEHEAQLILEDIGGSILLRAKGLGTPATLGTATQDGSTDTATFAFGAQGLGVKGTLWFADFQLAFPADSATGEVETEVAGHLAFAWYFLNFAQGIVESPPPHDMHAVLTYLFNASVHVGLEPQGAWTLLQAGLDGGTLLPTTNGPLAVKKAKTATGWIVPAFTDVSNLINAGKTSAAPVAQHIAVARKNIELALALVHGFQSKSHSKLLSSVEVTVE